MLKSLRSRLTLIMIGLVLVPLLAVGAMLTYRNFTNQQRQALDVEHEVAQGVGFQVETFIKQRNDELRVLDEVRGLRELSSEEQKTVLSSLLNYQQVYNDIALLDQTGQEQIRLSRLAVFGPADLSSRAEYDSFIVPATTRETYYGPVELDPTTDEPFMTIAVPLIDRRTNEVSNVLVAQFRFTTVWNLIADVQVTGDEDIFLVDAQGRVIAHRNPSVVLSGTHFTLPAKDGINTGLHKDQAILAMHKVQLGQEVFTVVADVPATQALSDAYRTLYLLLAGLGGVLVLTIVVGLFAVRQITNPLEALAVTARSLGSGDLARRAILTGRTEIDALAKALNAMAGQVQDSISSLEARVAARTRDLFLTLEVGQLVTRTYQQTRLMSRISEFIRERFNLYYVQVYLIDEAQRYAVLDAGTGEVGEMLLGRKHRLDLKETSIVARSVQTQRPVLVANTETSAVHKVNPLLPETRSEVAIPLIAGDQILGVLDMQARQADTFREDNLPVFEAMASQLASALRAAQSFAEAQVAVERAADVNRRLTGEAWEGYLGRAGRGDRIGYEYDLQTVEPLAEPLAVPEGSAGNGHENRIERAITLRNQPVGTLVVGEDTDRAWTGEELALIDSVAERVAQTVEQYRAFDETTEALATTEDQAKRLTLLNEMAAQLSAAPDLNEVYRITATKTDQILHSDRASIALLVPEKTHFEIFGLDGSKGAIPVGTKLPWEGTWIGKVAREGRVQSLRDMSSEPYPEARQLSGQGLLSSLNAPLTVGNEVIGTLNVANKQVAAYTPRDEALIVQIASLLSSHLQNQQLLTQTRKRAAEMQTVAEVGAQASASLDLNHLLNSVVNLTKEQFGLYHAHIYLFNEETEDLALAAGAGKTGERMVAAGHRIALNNERSLVARAARIRQAVMVNDVTQVSDFLPNPMLPGTRSEMAIPLLAGEEVVGVLDVQSDQPGRFTDEDISIQTTLASQVAAAVQNARLFADVQTVSLSLEERVRQIAALQDIGAYAEKDLPLDDYLKHVADRVPSSMHYPDLSVAAIEFEDKVYGDPRAMETPYRLAQPLVLASGQSGGQVNVGYIEEREFQPEEIPHLAAVAERVSTHLQTRLVTEETNILYAASSTLTQADTRDDLLHAVSIYARSRGSVAGQLAYIDSDAEGKPEWAEFVAEWKEQDKSAVVGNRYYLPDFVLAQLWLFDPNEPLMVQDVTTDERVDEASRAFFAQTGVQSVVILPLTVQNRWVALVLFSWDEPVIFRERDRRIFSALARTAAPVVDGARLTEQVRRRAAEMQTVAEVGAAAAASLDLHRLLHDVVELTKERFGLYHAHVYLLDDQNENLNLAAGSGLAGERMAAAGHSIPLDHARSLVARAARTRQAVIVNDVNQVPDFLPNPLLPDTQSEMALPLMSGERVIGVLDVQSEMLARFTESDVTVQTTLAAQVAAAVQNARLFTNVESSQRLMRAIVDNAAEWIFVKGSDYRYQLVNEPYAHAYNRSPEDYIGQNDYEMGFPPEVIEGDPARNILGLRGEDDLLLSGQTLPVLKNVIPLPDGSIRIFDTRKTALRDAAGNIMAVLGIAHDVTERDRAENIVRKRAVEMQTVAELGAAAAASLDQNKLLHDVVNLAQERFELYHAHIYLLDASADALTLAAGSGLAGERMVAAGHRIDLDNERSLVARAARSGEPVVVNDVTQAPDFLPNPMLALTRSELAIPLIAGERVIGVFDVQSKEVNRFTEEDIAVQTTLASQVAVAVQNARQYEQTQLRVRDLQILNQVTEQLRADESLEVTLEAVLVTIVKAMGGDNGMISRLDHDTQTWHGVVGSGEGITTQLAKTFNDPAATYPHGMEVVETRNVVTIDNSSDYPGFPQHYIDTLGIKSVLTMPVYFGTASTYVMFVNFNTQYHVFTPDEIALARGLADQIAIGTERKLSEETIRRRAVEMQTVAEVGAAAASSLDVDTLLRNVVDLTKARFNLYHAHIYLLDEDGDNLLLSAGSGKSGERMVAAGHQIAVANERSLVARAARDREGVVVNDVTLAPDFLPNPMLPRTKSEMATPLIVGEQVIGVLDVQSEDADRFSDEDLSVQSTLASQVAVAVQNARLYNEQVRTTDRLREVDRLKSEFLASMSHELRTPLNSIIGYAEVLLDGIDGDLTDDMTEDVGAIHGSGKHLLNLINDILDLAKIEAQQMDLVVERVKLKPLAEDIVNTSRVLLKNKPVDLLVDIPDDLPELHSDSLRLRQVISNLLTNAIKFTERGSITLQARVYEADPGMVEFIVRDTGIGIKAEHLPLVFDRFRQVDQSHTRRAGGTGLGLSITRQLVEMHGGQIWVESEFGIGSAFHFTIPTVEGTATPS